MQIGKTCIAVGVAAVLTAMAATPASAAWNHRGGYSHRGPGPVLGLVGGIVVGAATIATLPFAILGAAARPAPPPPSYYGPQGYEYPPPPPPPRYRGYYAPPPGYYGY